MTPVQRLRVLDDWNCDGGVIIMRFEEEEEEEENNVCVAHYCSPLLHMH
jgi:hypothetical protein